jgi:hypothetical protein
MAPFGGKISRSVDKRYRTRKRKVRESHFPRHVDAIALSEKLDDLPGADKAGPPVTSTISFFIRAPQSTWLFAEHCSLTSHRGYDSLRKSRPDTLGDSAVVHWRVIR